MDFLNQDCTKTLQEGLEELYVHRPDVAEVSSAKGKSFHDHDVTHVIFGCDTSIRGEIDLKPWILFGTDISYQEISNYQKDEEVKRLNKEGIELMGGNLVATFKLVYLLPQFIVTWLTRVRKMKKKWPHSGVSQKMFDARIVDLRDEYGIQIVAADS